MNRALQLLIGGTLLFGLAVSYPAYRLGGAVSLATAGLAALLCLLPTSATMFWASRASDGPPTRQLAAVLGGTGLRMTVVLAAGLFLSSDYPGLVIRVLQEILGASWGPNHLPTILTLWGWLLAFYLVTLGLEVAILVARTTMSSDASEKRRGECFSEASLNQS